MEAEDRPAIKRNRVDAEEKEKFISYIGHDTILSSVKKTKSEPTKTPLSGRKSAGAAGKKSLDKSLGSANPSGKKPLVQTLLGSSLSLRKPTLADATPSGARKSLGKLESPASEADEMTSLGSSVVVTKKSLPSSKKFESTKDDVASPGVRKVNISVSVVKSKETPAESPSPSLVVTRTSPVMAKNSEAPKTSRKSDVKSKDTPRSAPMKAKPSQVEQLRGKPSRKGEQDQSKKADPLALSPIKVPSQAGIAKKVEARKTFVGSDTLLARKSLSAGEISRKSEARKSEGGILPARKSTSQAELSKKSEEATAKELLSQKPASAGDAQEKVEAKKPEELETETSIETSNNIEPEEVAVKSAPKGREATKKAQAERKEELLASKQGPDTIAASTSTESLREDTVRATRSEKNALAARPRPLAAIRQAGHVTRATSSNRSLAATPSSEIEAPSIRGRRRGKGGRGRRMPAQKRKADEAVEAADPKRSKEMLLTEVHPENTKNLAFPVKISAANLETSEAPVATQPGKPVQKEKKLRVKINRRTFKKWLEQHQEPNAAAPEKGAASAVIQPTGVAGVAAEVDSAAKPISEQPQEQEPASAISDSQTSNSTISSDPSQNEKTKEQLAAATVPPVFPPVSQEPDSQLTTPSAPVPEPVPAPPPTASAPDPKAATKPAPEKGIAKETAQRKPPVPSKTMPLPVPILEVKDEPEDTPPEPMDQDVAPMPEAVAAPPAVPSVPVPPTINGRQVISMGYPSAVPRVSLPSIPSASAASSANPNAIGQTKMFSFLYPNRYQQSYGKVGLDFCCPNLDGPMRAIDPTRLHAKAEVPVLEVPQFLVITTKFISKADKNIPHKVRAKLEMLGKDKELDTSVGMDTSILTDPESTQLVIPPPEATPGTVIPPLNSQSLVNNLPPSAGSVPPTSEPAPYPACGQDTGLPDALDLLTKQLPKGTTLVKKILPPGATMPSASTSLTAASSSSTTNPSVSTPQPPPALIQLPPICPTDKHRVELQSRVQMFDMVLQTLSRRAATLTLAERQRTIEEIVKTSTLMPIDVDVGTKLLENYVHYLNLSTSTQTKLPTVRPSEVVPMAKAPDVVESQSVPTLQKIGTKDSSVPAPAPAPEKKKAGQKAASTSVPLYDSEKNIIGFRKVTNFDSAASSSAAATSRKGAGSSVASGSKTSTPKTVARKSSGGTPGQVNSLNRMTRIT